MALSLASTSSDCSWTVVRGVLPDDDPRVRKLLEELSRVCSWPLIMTPPAGVPAGVKEHIPNS